MSVNWPVLPSQGDHNHADLHTDERSAIDLAIASIEAGNSDLSRLGFIHFDDFDGTNDSERIASMNAWHMSRPTNTPSPAVLMPQRIISHNIPIWYVSGMKLHGLGSGSAREYSRSTVMRWTGSAGSSQMIMPYDAPGGPYTQPSQGYPNAYAPRNISIIGIQFESQSSSCHWHPQVYQGNYDPGAGDANRVLWASTIRDCGFKNFQTVMWGWCNAVTLGGATHIQGFYDSAFRVGGAENTFFADEHCFMDSSTSFANSNKPMFRSALDKSYIGKMMITARQTSYQLSIESGHNLVVDGLQIDAQTSDPVYGSGVKITGGRGITLSNMSFKGMMSDPFLGGGGPTGSSPGSGSNKGWIHITGGRQISVQGCNFARYNSTPAVTVPILYVGSGVNSFEVKWGLNNYSYWDNELDKAVLLQATTNRIYAIEDPKIQIDTE